jgi:hypothetical protein
MENIEFSNQLKPPKKVTKVELEENRKDEPIGVIIYIYIYIYYIYIYIYIIYIYGNILRKLPV